MRLRLHPGVTLRLPGGLRLEVSGPSHLEAFGPPDSSLEVLTTDDLYRQLAEERHAEGEAAHTANGVPDSDQPPF